MVVSIYVGIAAFPNGVSVSEIIPSLLTSFHFFLTLCSFFLISLVRCLVLFAFCYCYSVWMKYTDKKYRSRMYCNCVCPVLPPLMLHSCSSLPFLYDLAQQSSIHVLVLILHPIVFLFSLSVEFFVPVKDQFLAWFISNKAMLSMKFFPNGLQEISAFCITIAQWLEL